MKARQIQVQSWFLDQSLVLGYWSGEGKRNIGAREQLILAWVVGSIENEGLDNAWSRHYAMHQELKAGVEALGLKFVVDEESRLPQLNALYFPEGIDEAKIRNNF